MNLWLQMFESCWDGLHCSRMTINPYTYALALTKLLLDTNNCLDIPNFLHTTAIYPRKRPLNLVDIA